MKSECQASSVKIARFYPVFRIGAAIQILREQLPAACVRDEIVIEQLELAWVILRLPSHQTVFSVNASTTVCLSLGERPVCTPVSAQIGPPSTSEASPAAIACS